MEPIARFTIRPNGDRADLIIGGNGKNSPLKSNRVYEIREVLGELIIVDIGECAMDKSKWNHSINYLICHGVGYMVQTVKEWESGNETYILYQRRGH